MIQQVSVDGKDIQRLIFDRLMPAIEGEPLGHSVLSLLTLSVLLMRPDIDIEKLQDVVMSTSEHMILSMTDMPEGQAN